MGQYLVDKKIEYYDNNRKAIIGDVLLYVSVFIIVFVEHGLLKALTAILLVLGFSSHYYLLNDSWRAVRLCTKISIPFFFNMGFACIIFCFMAYNGAWIAYFTSLFVPIVVVVVVFISR